MIHAVDHISGKLAQATVGEDLNIPPPNPLRGHLGLGPTDEEPALFFSVSGLFSGLERWLGTAVVPQQHRLCPAGESLPP